MNQALWDKAVNFHGHECPGLAIGVRACEAAMEKMGLKPAYDEEVVCITENDACGVDGVQALMCCTMGKGNLIYKPTGKQAFTFIRRGDGKGMRFYLKALNNGLSRPEFQAFLLSAPLDEVFAYKEISIKIPEQARLFASVVCEICGEMAPEHKMRLQDGKNVCLDCFKEYTRGW